MAEISKVERSKKYMNEIVEGLSYSDFNNDGFNAFEKSKILNDSERNGFKSKDFSDKEKREIIQQNNLENNQRPTRYAVVFFHQSPAKFVTGAYVTITMYDENNKIIMRDKIGSDYGNVKNDISKGRPLICSVEDTIAILYDNYLGKQFYIDGMIRNEKKPIPLEIIREAIVNAHIHKDYSSEEPIRIEIYPETIRIYNRCFIHDVQSIKKGIKLNRLNAKLCEAMGQTIYYEGEGSGVARMRDELSKANLRDVEYELNDDTLCTILPNPSGIQYSGNEQKKFNVNILGPDEVLILKAALSASITRKDIEELISKEKTQAGKISQSLKMRGLLQMIGNGPSVHYVLTDLGKKAINK